MTIDGVHRSEGGVGSVVDPALVARVLANPLRARLHALLLASDVPVRVDDLAAEFGVHHTAVRQHLAVLGVAGLVESVRLDSHGRGRPAVGWTAVPVPPAPHERLAGALAEALRTGRSARDQGRADGTRLQAEGVDDLHRVVASATAWGFDPAVEAIDDARVHVVLQQCPFAGLASADPATICDLHRGLAEGLTGNELQLEEMRVTDPHEGGCRLVLQRMAGERRKAL